MEVRRISPFGAEVRVSTVPLAGSEEAERIAGLYREEGLVVVRGLSLDQAEQIRFCRLFGPVQETPYENFLVSNVDEDGQLGTRELLWHNDVPYLPSPYPGASLHALEVDPGTASTRFVSGYQAYANLPERLRRRVEGMKALHVRERVYDRPNRLTDLQAGDMCTVHDVVRTESGRRFLFVNQAWTAQIIGLTDGESDDLLEELFGHYYADGAVYEHSWTKGDLVLWDNLAVQHARGKAGSGRRRLQRVTIAGLGYADQYPTDLGIRTSLGNRELFASSI